MLQHPAIMSWCKKAGQRVSEAGGIDLPDRAETWWRAVSKQPNWKAPGPDGIPAYWYKAFQGITSRLGEEMWELVDSSWEFPQWFVAG